ncbi:hypothetical protein SLE2022_362960 [Rubroshorea leprosula]
MGGGRVIGWAARDASGHLSPYSFTLKKTSPEDVVLQVLFCGIDHTDFHQIRSEITPANYPLILGHEVVGEVVELGSEVRSSSWETWLELGAWLALVGTGPPTIPTWNSVSPRVSSFMVTSIKMAHPLREDIHRPWWFIKVSRERKRLSQLAFAP